MRLPPRQSLRFVPPLLKLGGSRVTTQIPTAKKNDKYIAMIMLKAQTNLLRSSNGIKWFFLWFE